MYTQYMPHGAEIKVGKASPATDGDFSAYKMFGTLPNPTQFATTYIIKQPEGVKGRFLSIQMPFDWAVLHFCYNLAI